MVTSTDIAVMQRGTPWTSDAPYTTPITPTSAEYDIGQGDDIAIAIEVATTMTADVQAFLHGPALPVRRLVVLGPPGGPRDNAVAGPSMPAPWPSASAMPPASAAHGHPRVHLFLATPMGLALLLGHRWNRVAPTIVYEDLAALGYEAAFTISA